VDGWNTRVCRHLDTGTKYTGRFHDLERIPQLADSEGRTYGQAGFVPCDRDITRCRFCHADIETSIVWRGYRQKGWLIRIVAYRSLGKCRDPDDMMAMMGRGLYNSDGSRRSLRDLSQPLLRDRWIGNDKSQDVADEAKWRTLVHRTLKGTIEILSY
jgi:hypothetical protein